MVLGAPFAYFSSKHVAWLLHQLVGLGTFLDDAWFKTTGAVGHLTPGHLGQKCFAVAIPICLTH